MPRYFTTFLAASTSGLPGNPIEKHVIFSGPIIFDAIATIKLESNPPESKKPIGLSDSNLF